MEEIWKPIIGYEGYYEISNFGRVKSIDRYVKQGNTIRHCKEKIKNPYMHPSGYPVVTLSKNKKSKCYKIHRLIAIAFIPNPENKQYIDHINTDKTDYRIENLRWVTAKENSNNEITLKHLKENTYTKDVIQKRLITSKRNKTKSSPKTIFQYTKNGHFIKEYFSINEAAITTKIHRSAIQQVLNDNTQSAGNYMWFDSFKENIKYIKRQHTNSKPVCQLDKQGNIIKEWPSLSDASKETGIYISNITRNINLKNTRKYKFVFKDDI